MCDRVRKIDDWHLVPWCRFDDPACIQLEVVGRLSWLNRHLMTAADVPFILEFLETPPGEEEIALRRWFAYWRDLDYDARTRELESDDYYSTWVTRRFLRRRAHGGG